MPYDNEYAQYRALQRVAQNPAIQHLLARSHPVTISGDSLSSLPLISFVDNDTCESFTRLLSIDGSFAEAPVSPTAQQAMFGFITVAAVETDLARLRLLDNQRPCDPQALPRIYQVHALDGALTGPHIVLDDDLRPRDSVRRSLYELFAQARWSARSETLLDTYEAVVRHSGTRGSVHQRCPYAEHGCQHPQRRYRSQQGAYLCSCSHHYPLWSLDALRLYERLPHFGSNRAMLAEVMNLLEHLWLLHYLRWLEREQRLEELQTTLLVMDGPLALYSSLSWLSHAVRLELARINQVAQHALHDPDFQLALVGIEKTGAFVDYADDLIRHDLFPAGTALLLTDSMIKQHIVSWAGNRAYGSTTAYGRKLLYRTRTGTPFVINIPMLNAYHHDVSTAYPDQFPRLSEILALIETLVGSRYTNALTPLVTAHAEVALPLRFGTTILSQLTADHAIGSG